MIRNKRGVTIVALIITVIVMLILSAVSIRVLVGENGILNNTNYAKEETEKKQAIEQARSDMLAKFVRNKKKQIPDEDLKEILNKYFDDVPENLTDVDQELKTKENGFPVTLKEIFEDTEVYASGTLNPGNYGGHGGSSGGCRS